VAGERNLQKGLEAIGFVTENSENPSIIFVSELKNTNQSLTPFQILELEKASYFNADAVFFRYFEDNRPPLSQVYIYDNSNSNLSVEYSQIHKELWSNCHIPTFIIVEQTKLKIFDCRKPVSFSGGVISTKETAYIDLNDIGSYADVVEKYNAEKFKNGSFWESEEAHKNYLYGKTAYTNLIDKLKILRKNYNRKLKISSQLFDYVIIISTLIKFLEENGVDANGDNLASDFFQDKVQCSSFIEILQQNKLVAILENLSTKFNGGIFDLTDAYKAELANANLTPIINFFNPKINSKDQLVLWDLYSFKHIPVELISNIYEEFLPAEDKGAVYTPHYLVNFLIDECLPIPTQNELNNSKRFTKKTIDVSCGSGIFLVNSFKRLVQIYKINEFYKNDSLPKKIGIKILQKILRENIFGVDVNKNAVELTKFSLQLALCQMLSPKQIWTELEFQNLGKNNILQKDFFDFITNQKVHKQFDLVIGNPPFNPPPKEDGTEYSNSEYFNEIVEKYTIKAYPIKDHNLALLFLQLSTKLLQTKGLLCLIQPAVPLLHNKDNQIFRQKLFNENNVLQITDFTTLRRVLFPSATIPTCAVFIQNNKTKNDFITHIVVRRTNPSKERLFFEIDTYDIHSVAQKDAINNYSWKCNLFGGYRLFNLIQKLNKNSKNLKASNFIDNNKSVAKNYSVIKSHIANTIGIYFETKITEGTFPIYVAEGTTKMNAKILGLLGTKKSIEFLRKYFNENSNLLVSYIAGTSSRQGLDRPYDVLISDFKNLPIIEDKNKLTIADKILTNDIADYKINEFGNGENAITNNEIKIIGGKLPIAIKEFSDVYIDALNSIYSVGTKKVSLKEVYNTPSCFVVCFEYGKHLYQVDRVNQQKKLDLLSLVNDEETKTVLFKKITIIHNQNKIFIVKPKQLRYWLKSIALLDADTTIADIINLNLLKR
jgi:methylase of polypeptide subunit release factors